MNNMHQIAYALSNYEATYGELPPAHTTDADAKPLHSWRVLILPFAEYGSIYSKIDLSKPWDHPANSAMRNQCPAIFRCPSGKIPTGHTTYLASVGEHQAFLASQPRKKEEVLDGLQNTLLLYETDAAHSVEWMSPLDANDELILSQNDNARAPHTSTAIVAYMDGSVRSIPRHIPPEILRALLTIDGNEEIGNQD